MTHYEIKSQKELRSGIRVQGIAAIVSEAKRQTVGRKRILTFLIPLLLLHFHAMCQIEDYSCDDISRMTGPEVYYILQRDTMFCVSVYLNDSVDSVVYKPLEKIKRNIWLSRSSDSTLYWELKLIRSCHKNKRGIPGKDYRVRYMIRYENGLRKFKIVYLGKMLYKKNYYN